ncbi:DUF1127 domain-containing protein [Pseudoruegeria sp. HB172150]|uniref:DUF1127 domain-containing protein n=1 Tax=Pseudoruegeria sp. HB172150 TaxID=2721164 RepID=UPI001553C90B|nr:DUF1127 domain-containing protein [Pseudoruegeria sp. HB172150]
MTIQKSPVVALTFTTLSSAPAHAIIESLQAPFLWAARTVRLWREDRKDARDCAALFDMSDALLNDIGLCRHDIVQALEEERALRRDRP